ncbi:MAG: hypothetical protein COA46_04745 [Porticoccaceae bacterium]|nr:MAG: hypothetical protein COA46_04745 [Porticoccaceae bacterium]
MLVCIVRYAFVQKVPLFLKKFLFLSFDLIFKLKIIVIDKKNPNHLIRACFAVAWEGDPQALHLVWGESSNIACI